MRLRSAGIAILFWAAASPALSETLKPSKYPRVYRGGEGITVTVIPLMPSPEKDALVEVKGIETKIDEVVLRHKAVEGNDPAWSTTIAGEGFWTLRSEKIWGWKRLLLILPEKPMETIDMVYDEKASKKVKAQEFVKRHEKQLKDGTIQKLAAWNRSERESGNNESFNKDLAAMNQACGTKITANIDWKSVTDEHLKRLSISSYCSPGINALADACTKPEAKGKITKSVKSLICRFTEKDLKMKLEADGSIQWLTHSDASNVDDFAKAYVQNQF